MMDQEFQEALLHNVQIFKDEKLQEIVKRVVRGRLGDGEQREYLIKSEGYNYETVRQAVNFLYAYTQGGIYINENYHWFSD